MFSPLVAAALIGFKRHDSAFTAVKKKIIFFCQRMDEKGWVANHDGNLSVKLGENRFLCTPSGKAKFDLKEEDLIEIDLEGNLLTGRGKVFSEWKMHRSIYEARPEVRTVIHSHAPHASSVGMTGQEMLTSSIPEAIVTLGPGVPLISLDLPDSPELLGELSETAKHYHAFLMAGNGVFSTGVDLEQAFLRMELVEHLARMLLGSLSLGKPAQLSAAQIKKLLAKRESAGLALPLDPKRPHWFPG